MCPSSANTDHNLEGGDEQKEEMTTIKGEEDEVDVDDDDAIIEGRRRTSKNQQQDYSMLLSMMNGSSSLQRQLLLHQLGLSDPPQNSNKDNQRFTQNEFLTKSLLSALSGQGDLSTGSDPSFPVDLTKLQQQQSSSSLRQSSSRHQVSSSSSSSNYPSLLHSHYHPHNSSLKESLTSSQLASSHHFSSSVTLPSSESSPQPSSSSSTLSSSLSRNHASQLNVVTNFSPNTNSNISSSPSNNTTNPTTTNNSNPANWKRNYSQAKLERALDDILSGKLGTRRAAVIYGIPRSTLRNKVYKLEKNLPEGTTTGRLANASGRRIRRGLLSRHHIVDSNHLVTTSGGTSQNCETTTTEDSKATTTIKETSNASGQQLLQQLVSSNLASSLSLASSSALITNNSSPSLSPKSPSPPKSTGTMTPILSRKGAGESLLNPPTRTRITDSRKAKARSSPSSMSSGYTASESLKQILRENIFSRNGSSLVSNRDADDGNPSIGFTNPFVKDAASLLSQQVSPTSNSSLMDLAGNPFLSYALSANSATPNPSNLAALYGPLSALYQQQSQQQPQQQPQSNLLFSALNSQTSPQSTSMSPQQQLQQQLQQLQFLQQLATAADPSIDANAFQSFLAPFFFYSCLSMLNFEKLLVANASNANNVNNNNASSAHLPAHTMTSSSLRGEDGSIPENDAMDDEDDEDDDEDEELVISDDQPLDLSVSSSSATHHNRRRIKEEKRESNFIPSSIGGNRRSALKDLLDQHNSSSISTMTALHQNLNNIPANTLSPSLVNGITSLNNLHTMTRGTKSNASSVTSEESIPASITGRLPVLETGSNTVRRSSKSPSMSSSASSASTRGRGKLERDASRSSASPSLETTKTSSQGGSKNRPKRGKYRNYDSEVLNKAVLAVQSGEMSVHRAGTFYGVPHSTLEYKVKQRHLLREKKRQQQNGSTTGSGSGSNSCPTTTMKHGAIATVTSSSPQPSDMIRTGSPHDMVPNLHVSSLPTLSTTINPLLPNSSTSSSHIAPTNPVSKTVSNLPTLSAIDHLRSPQMDFEVSKLLNMCLDTKLPSYLKEDPEEEREVDNNYNSDEDDCNDSHKKAQQHDTKSSLNGSNGNNREQTMLVD